MLGVGRNVGRGAHLLILQLVGVLSMPTQLALWTVACFTSNSTLYLQSVVCLFLILVHYMKKLIYNGHEDVEGKKVSIFFSAVKRMDT